VNVTYMVDITDYVTAGNVVGVGGIRIGGDFVATAGTNGVAPMPAWVPSDPACAMVDLGSNVWSITVTYPITSIGAQQLYKFVNNDWGTNEGTDTLNTIGADGCGLDDGGGNVNRTLVIPDADLMLLYCWDRCYQCDGSDPDVTVGIIETPANLGDVAITPNPVSNTAEINFTLQNASEVNVSIFNLMGEEVKTIMNSTETSGFHNYSIDVSSLPSGNYVYRVVAGEAVTSGNIVKL
ncbi:MAG: T9SS type A sorting domain-containing protein, partial [Chitinophagales bacterium]